jgi:hypothetical protein
VLERPSFQVNSQVPQFILDQRPRVPQLNTFVHSVVVGTHVARVSSDVTRVAGGQDGVRVIVFKDRYRSKLRWWELRLGARRLFASTLLGGTTW